MDSPHANGPGRIWLAVAVSRGAIAALLAAGLVAVGLVMGWTAASSYPAPPGAEQLSAEALVAAKDYWDNPFQRLSHLSVAVTQVRNSDPACPSVEVSAFTLFGVVVDKVDVDCREASRHGSD